MPIVQFNMTRNRTARKEAGQAKINAMHIENARQGLSAFVIGLGDLSFDEQIARIRRKNDANVFSQLQNSEKKAIQHGDESSVRVALDTFESLARQGAWIMFQSDVESGKATIAAALFRDIPLNNYNDAASFAVTPIDLCTKVLDESELSSIVSGMNDLGRKPQNEWSLNDELRRKSWAIFSLNLNNSKNNSLLAQNIRNIQAYIVRCGKQVILSIVNVFEAPFDDSFKKLYPQIEPQLVDLLEDFLERNPGNSQARTFLKALQAKPSFEPVIKDQVQQLLASEGKERNTPQDVKITKKKGKSGHAKHREFPVDDDY